MKTTKTMVVRRVFVLLPLALLFRSTSAQDVFSVEFVREITMPREQLFNHAALWLAESTASSKSVIELKDKEIGTIIGNASADLKIGWGVTMPIQFKLRVDVKDNKYRMTFSQVQVDTSYGVKPIEQANRESLEPKARELFEQIEASYNTYVTAAAKEKSW